VQVSGSTSVLVLSEFFRTQRVVPDFIESAFERSLVSFPLSSAWMRYMSSSIDCASGVFCGTQEPRTSVAVRELMDSHRVD
jgi:hypothetical protein